MEERQCSLPPKSWFRERLVELRDIIRQKIQTEPTGFDREVIDKFDRMEQPIRYIDFAHDIIASFGWTKEDGFKKLIEEDD